MRALYLGGWILVVMACFGAMAETAAHMVPHARGFFLSAYDVWYALAPGNLVVTRIRIESLLGPWAWDPVMVSLLAVPAWVLFGVPGTALIWFGRPRGRPGDDIGREEEESLFLFDTLAEHAEAEEREFAAFESQLDAGPLPGDPPELVPPAPEGDAERHRDLPREEGEP